MKNIFLNYAMNRIRANNDFDEIRLAELKYGLETFYLLITKLIVIIALAIGLGIIKELMLFIIFFTPLRSFGYGFHANTSLECWLISVPIFIILPILAKYLTIPLLVCQIFIIMATISFYLFAPADTKKKPLINQKKRLIQKTILVTFGLIYLGITMVTKNTLIINLISFAALWQAICVNPLIYKIFGQTFNNYKTYLKEV